MGRKFVVQEHHARTKHFDFRLEVGGVLVSWAVPKGISKDPKVKRLAIQMPDHSLSWGRFEGVIPKGEPGAGTVKIWDKGTYKNLGEEDLAKGIRKGHIAVWLEGKKLKGGYALTRFRGEDQWLLVKMRDDRG